LRPLIFTHTLAPLLHTFMYHAQYCAH